MPNVTTLDPAALQYSEINRRAELARTPIQFAQSLGAGLQAGQAVQGIQDQNEKRQKAQQFEQILQQGLPAMKQAWQEAGSPPEWNPDLGYAETRDLALTFWQGMTEKHRLAQEAQTRAQIGTDLAGGNYDSAAGAASGLVKDPTSLINTGREQAAKDKTQAAKDAKESDLSQKFAQLRTQGSALLQKNGGKLKPEDINLLLDKADPALSGYEPFNKWADNLKKQPEFNPMGMEMANSRKLSVYVNKFDHAQEQYEKRATPLQNLIGTMNSPTWGTAAGDISLINQLSLAEFGGYKPSEAEYKAFGKGFTPAEYAQKWLSFAQDGNVLPEKVRKNMVKEIEEVSRKSHQNFRTTMAEQKKRVVAAGLNPDEVIYPGGTFQDLEDYFNSNPAPATAAPSGGARKPTVKPKSDPLGLF